MFNDKIYKFVVNTIYKLYMVNFRKKTFKQKSSQVDTLMRSPRNRRNFIMENTNEKVC